MILLSGRECRLVVFSSIFTIDLGEVESLREKIMDQRAKSYAIGPRGGEIFNLDVLKRSGLSLNVS